MPDGKRVALSTRVSEATAARVDEARGQVTRSAWLEAVIADALAQATSEPAARKPRPARSPAPVSAASGQCAHPKARVNKGLCGACGTGGLS